MEAILDHCFVEYSDWPTSPTTAIVNQSSPGTYDGTSSANRYEKLVSDATSFTENVSTHTDFISIPPGEINNLGSHTLEFIFYYRGQSDTAVANLFFSKWIEDWIFAYKIRINTTWGSGGVGWLEVSRVSSNSVDYKMWYMLDNRLVPNNYYTVQISWDATDTTNEPTIVINDVVQTLIPDLTNPSVGSWLDDAGETVYLCNNSQYANANAQGLKIDLLLFRAHSRNLSIEDMHTNYVVEAWRIPKIITPPVSYTPSEPALMSYLGYPVNCFSTGLLDADTYFDMLVEEGYTEVGLAPSPLNPTSVSELSPYIDMAILRGLKVYVTVESISPPAIALKQSQSDAYIRNHYVDAVAALENMIADSRISGYEIEACSGWGLQWMADLIHASAYSQVLIYSNSNSQFTPVDGFVLYSELYDQVYISPPPGGEIWGGWFMQTLSETIESLIITEVLEGSTSIEVADNSIFTIGDYAYLKTNTYGERCKIGAISEDGYTITLGFRVTIHEYPADAASILCLLEPPKTIDWFCTTVDAMFTELYSMDTVAPMIAIHKWIRTHYPAFRLGVYTLTNQSLATNCYWAKTFNNCKYWAAEDEHMCADDSGVVNPGWEDIQDEVTHFPVRLLYQTRKRRATDALMQLKAGAGLLDTNVCYFTPTWGGSNIPPYQTQHSWLRGLDLTTPPHLRGCLIYYDGTCCDPLDGSSSTTNLVNNIGDVPNGAPYLASHKYDATLYGATSTSLSSGAGALAFDGIDDYCIIPEGIDHSFQKYGYTVEFRFYHSGESLTTTPYIFWQQAGTSGRWACWIDTDDQNIHIAHSTDTGDLEYCTPANSINYVAWYVVQLKWDLTTLTTEPVIIIDNAAQSLTTVTQTGTTLLDDTGNDMYIGSDGANENPINAVISLFRFFPNIMLSDAELGDNYAAAIVVEDTCFRTDVNIFERPIITINAVQRDIIKLLTERTAPMITCNNAPQLIPITERDVIKPITERTAPPIITCNNAPPIVPITERISDIIIIAPCGKRIGV